VESSDRKRRRFLENAVRRKRKKGEENRKQEVYSCEDERGKLE